MHLIHMAHGCDVVSSSCIFLYLGTEHTHKDNMMNVSTNLWLNESLCGIIKVDENLFC